MELYKTKFLYYHENYIVQVENGISSDLSLYFYTIFSIFTVMITTKYLSLKIPEICIYVIELRSDEIFTKITYLFDI